MDFAWTKNAACRGIDPSVFYPPTDDEAAPAKFVCAACPVTDACLEHAITHREREGVWGGATEAERVRIIRRRRRERRRELAAVAAG